MLLAPLDPAIPTLEHAALISATGTPVTVYWRPMCGYCEELKSALDARGVAYDTIDIWADRAKAELVKAATGGDEIVPTVQVGEATFLVNPSVDEVLKAARTPSGRP